VDVIRNVSLDFLVQEAHLQGAQQVWERAAGIRRGQGEFADHPGDGLNLRRRSL
jgi:hypothetical protein